MLILEEVKQALAKMQELFILDSRFLANVELKSALVHQMSIPALPSPQHCTCRGEPHPIQPHFWEMALSLITGAARIYSLPPF